MEIKGENTRRYRGKQRRVQAQYYGDEWGELLLI
jgi:hypothetical protein